MLNYDVLGNRTSAVLHRSAAAGGDVTSTYVRPVSGESSTRPHAVSSVTAKTPSATLGSSSFTYDAAGNTPRRKTVAVRDVEHEAALSSKGSISVPAGCGGLEPTSEIACFGRQDVGRISVRRTAIRGRAWGTQVPLCPRMDARMQRAGRPRTVRKLLSVPNVPGRRQVSP